MRTRSGGRLAAVAVAVALAALAGWTISDLLAPEPPVRPPQPRTATAGPVTLVVDGSWVPARRVPGVPGLDPALTAAFRPAAGLPAYAFATVAPIRDGSLLPAPLRALLPATPRAPERTTLRGRPALHYAEQAIPGDRRMEVTVVPTTAGALAVACVAPRASWVVALGCADGIHGLALRDAAWLEPSGDLAARARIPDLISRLDARRATLRSKLAGAPTRRAQARFAERLARAYGAAAAALAPIAPESGPAAAVAGALRDGAAAYRKLAAAAARGRPKRYRAARRGANRADAALNRALTALR